MRDSNSPFRFFWKRPLHARCPECQRYAPAGFPGDELDAGICTACWAAHFEAEVTAESLKLGYPLTTQGPCSRCYQPCYLYGPGGSSVCRLCRIKELPADQREEWEAFLPANHTKR